MSCSIATAPHAVRFHSSLASTCGPFVQIIHIGSRAIRDQNTGVAAGNCTGLQCAQNACQIVSAPLAIHTAKIAWLGMNELTSL